MMQAKYSLASAALLAVSSAHVTLAPAQPPCVPATITLFRDVLGIDCALSGASGTVETYHVVQINASGMSVTFAAPLPPCLEAAATWVGDVSVHGFLTEGDSQTGVTVAFGECFPQPVHVLSIVVAFSSSIPPPVCCEYRVSVQPDDVWSAPTYVDCNGVSQVSRAGFSVVNATPTCHCGLPVPTEATTWGAVKALYRELRGPLGASRADVRAR